MEDARNPTQDVQHTIGLLADARFAEQRLGIALGHLNHFTDEAEDTVRSCRLKQRPQIRDIGCSTHSLVIEESKNAA